MPRPMWSGSISFGLVNIPIKMYNAVKRKTLHFNQLRQSDGCRIRLKKVCESDGSEVANEQIIKGYEVSPDQYVIITQSELDALSPKASRSIEIEDFVHLKDINPIYYEHSYYLVPDKGAGKSYSLLLQAMEHSKRIAIARFVLRNKQYLAAIRPNGQTLTLSSMYFSDEIVAQAELEDLPEKEYSEVDKRELSIALQLIESLSNDFNPDKYQDDYRDQVLNMIEKKAEGQQVVSRPATAQGAKVIDLMQALEASLAEIKKEKPASAKSRRKNARAQ